MYALWQEHQQLMRHDKIHPTQDLYYESYNYKKMAVLCFYYNYLHWSLHPKCIKTQYQPSSSCSVNMVTSIACLIFAFTLLCLNYVITRTDVT